jgi:hypothetical protein
MMTGYAFEKQRSLPCLAGSEKWQPNVGSCVDEGSALLAEGLRKLLTDRLQSPRGVHRNAVIQAQEVGESDTNAVQTGTDDCGGREFTSLHIRQHSRRWSHNRIFGGKRR